MSDKRRYERRPCAELINLSTSTRKDRAGLARDVSAIGMLFHSRSRFEPGERVHVQLHFPEIGERQLEARIVRTSAIPDYTSIFPHAAALEFESPDADLVDYFRE